MAAAAPTSTWTPPPGRHTVDLGSSLMRALKARQSGGDAQPMRSLHKKDFYSFRYNFKPGQVDSGARGKITTKRPKDSSSNVSVSVEHPSTRPGDVHLFAGEQQPSKDFDCVLIFDEASGTFTLEKLDSGITLNYLKKQTVGGKTVSPPPAPPVPDPNAMDIDQAADQLERDILSAAEGSDGEEVEIDQELFDEIIPKSFSRKSEQKPPSRAIPMEEEEEEEEIPIAVAAKVTKPPPPAPAPAAKPPKPAAKPKLAKSAAKATPKAAAAAAAAAPAQPSPRTTAPAKSKAKPSPPQPAPPVSAAVATPTPAPTKAKAAPVSRPTKKKREPEPVPAPPVSASMGEDIEIFSLPKPSKRPRVSPPPEPASEGWALPGSTTAVSRPPPVAPPVSAAASSSLPPPIAAAELEESDDEDDWDEVAAVDDPVPAPPDPSADVSGVEDDFDIFGEAMKEDDRDEDGEGDDHDLFANQLNQELGLTMEEDSDEDFLRDMVEEAPPSAVIPQREGLGAGPISLKALAGDGDDSEDYSSSDDSDDD